MKKLFKVKKRNELQPLLKYSTTATRSQQRACAPGVSCDPFNSVTAVIQRASVRLINGLVGRHRKLPFITSSNV